MEDKVIEIARFESTAEADILASLLKSEGIDCYVRDGLTSRTLFGYVDIGGAKVDLLIKDAKLALQIMKDHNYEISETLRESLLSENPGQDNFYNDFARERDESYSQDNNFVDESSEIEDDNNAIDDLAIYKEKESRLSRNMTIIVIIMVILFCILVLLNRYFKGQ